MVSEADQKLLDLFGLDPKSKKKNKIITDRLLEPVKKDKGLNAPHFSRPKIGVTWQADIMYLPDDDGYKYALVVADIGGSRPVDAEPIKDKSAATVLAAFKKIIDRKILKKSTRLEVDPGSEFLGVFKQYCEDHNIIVRTGKVNRHKMQAIVESKNGIIAKALFRRMSAQEDITGEKSTQWTEDLPKLIKTLNALSKRKSLAKYKPPEKPEVLCEGTSCDILKENDLVRVKLEAPIDNVDNKRIHGKFRATDQRWDKTIRTIKQVSIAPGRPVFYLLNDLKNKDKFEPVGYTKNELQLVDPKESVPKGKDVVRGKPKTYVVEKFLDRKNLNGRIFFNVKYVGYDEPSWELRKDLLEDVPGMVKAWEKKKK